MSAGRDPRRSVRHPIDGAIEIVGDEQRAVLHDLHVNRSAYIVVVHQEAGDEWLEQAAVLVRLHRAILVQPQAGAEAGAYLEEISKTDIATLDAGEWREFLRRLFVGYELALRRKILNNEPPF
jgi:hypothetical protein